MNRLNRALIALSICGGLFVAAPLFAQEQKTSQPLKPILSGKFVPPVRGVAEVQYLKPKITRKGKQVVTVIQVKNISTAPIAGLKCDETWYDKQRSLVPGGDQFKYNKLFQPGEIITVTLTDDLDARMDSNTYQFTHANGTVKAKMVPKF